MTDPDKISPSDLYADLPLYGRYQPKPADFRIDRQHVNSQSTESLRYWASVLVLCDESARIYPADDGGRDVFALGSIIVKSSHLHTQQGTKYIEIDYTYADANEIQATAIAKTVLKDIRVPEIYFSGKVFALTTWLRQYIATTHTHLDQWPPGTGSRKTSRCCIGRRLALSFGGSTRVLQTAGTKYTSTIALHQAYRWIWASVLRGSGSHYSPPPTL